MLLPFFFFFFLNWASHLVKQNFPLWKIWPCHAMVPLNVRPRWRMFNQLSGAAPPHRSSGGCPQLTAAPAPSQEPQRHDVKPQRVEPWLFPGEEVAAGMPDVPFPQQLVEGPALPGWVAASAETKPRKFAKFPQARENPSCAGPQATQDEK